MRLSTLQALYSLTKDQRLILPKYSTNILILNWQKHQIGKIYISPSFYIFAASRSLCWRFETFQVFAKFSRSALDKSYCHIHVHFCHSGMHIVDLSRSLCCSNYFEHLTKILHSFPAPYLTPYDVIQTILDQQWTRDERKTNQDPNSKTIEQRLLILWPWKKTRN